MGLLRGQVREVPAGHLPRGAGPPKRWKECGAAMLEWMAARRKEHEESKERAWAKTGKTPPVHPGKLHAGGWKITPLRGSIKPRDDTADAGNSQGTFRLAYNYGR